MIEVPIGTRFGYLITTSHTYTAHTGAIRRYYVDTVCECGGTKAACKSDLFYGRIKSCGCKQVTRQPRKHGYARAANKEALYKIWIAVKTRCYNENISHYASYGGKGVRVCAEWHDYTTFREWSIANGYADGLTIDRIDVNGDYAPHNCRWLTASANSIRKTVRVIRSDGVLFRSAYVVADQVGFCYDYVRNRIHAGIPINGQMYYWYELQGPCLPSYDE